MGWVEESLWRTDCKNISGMAQFVNNKANEELKFKWTSIDMIIENLIRTDCKKPKPPKLPKQNSERSSSVMISNWKKGHGTPVISTTIIAIKK